MTQGSSFHDIEPVTQPDKHDDNRSLDGYFRQGMIIDNKFTIEDILGKGGMGIVFKAFDNDLKRMVALKSITPGYMLDETDLRRFSVEAEAMAQVRSPHVVQVFSYNLKGLMGRPYIAMELVEGTSLDSLIKEHNRYQKPFEKELVAKFVYELAVGLNDIHEKGIINRDVKPSNIMIENSTGLVKIIDFGTAKKTSKESLTQTGASIGTVDYMAPEQALNPKEIDKRVDIYSLALIAYELLTLEQNFQGSGGVIQKFAKKFDKPARSIKETHPFIEHVDAIDAVLKDALSIDPDNRPGTAKEFAVDFGKAVLHGISPNQQDKKSSRSKKGAVYGLAAGALVSIAMAGGAIVFGSMTKSKSPVEDKPEIVQPADPKPVVETEPIVKPAAVEEQYRQHIQLKPNKSYSRLEVLARRYEEKAGGTYFPAGLVALDNKKPTRLEPGPYQIEVSVDDKTYYIPFMMPENEPLRKIELNFPDKIPTKQNSPMEFVYLGDAQGKQKPAYIGLKELTVGSILNYLQHTHVIPQAQKYEELMRYLNTNARSFLQKQMSLEQENEYLQKYAEWYNIDNNILRRGPAITGADQRRQNMFKVLVERAMMSSNEFDQYNPLLGVFTGNDPQRGFQVYVNIDPQKFGRNINPSTTPATGMRALAINELLDFYKQHITPPHGYELSIPTVELMQRAASGDGLFTFMNSHQSTDYTPIIDVNDQRTWRPGPVLQSDVSPHGVQGLLRGTQYATDKDDNIVIVGWSADGYGTLKDLRENQYNFLSPSTSIRFAMTKKD